MATGLKLTLLMLSYLGYWLHLHRKYDIEIFFTPFLTLGWQFAVLFAAGILNYLPEAVVLIFGGGIAFLLYDLWKGKKDGLKDYARFGFLAFFAAIAILALGLRGQRFTQIDNFTHWATVVTNLLSTDRFPNFADTAVEFTSYPLGSSALIYYFCKIVGSAEYMQMLAQSFLVGCCILPLFSFVKKGAVLGNAVIVIMAVFFQRYNIPATELLVDTLLPLGGMACLTFVFSQCMAEQHGLYFAVPVLFWTMNIKHAGVFYVVLALAAWLLWAEKGQRRQAVIVGLILAVGRSVWSRHCSYVYIDADASQHAMSLQWFSIVLGSKTWADITRTITAFFVYIFNRPAMKWMAVWFAGSVLLGICGKEQGKHQLKISASALGIYAVYSLSVLGMYIFSMSGSGELQSVERYLRTGDITAYYLLTIGAVQTLDRMGKRQHYAIAGAVLLAICASSIFLQETGRLGYSFVSSTAQARKAAEVRRAQIEEPAWEHGVEKRKSYLLCVSAEEDSDPSRFPSYVWKYNMESGRVNQLTVTEAEDLAEERNYDYLIILDTDNPIIQQWVQQHYPDQVGKQVIQHFV